MVVYNIIEYKLYRSSVVDHDRCRCVRFGSVARDCYKMHCRYITYENFANGFWSRKTEIDHFCVFTVGDCLSNSSAVKTGENFYFVNDLSNPVDFGRDFFSRFGKIVNYMFFSLNENSVGNRPTNAPDKPKETSHE